MTSPARWTMTVSPMRMSRPVAQLLALAADAFDVVLVVQRDVLHDDAADADRLKLADRREARRFGRPGSRSHRAHVMARSAGNLCAIAQRGVRETNPSRSCQSMRSIL